MSKHVHAAIALAIAGALVIALARRSTSPVERQRRSVQVRVPSWNDRVEREPPPEYIPAWMVNPPRPHADPAPEPAPERADLVLDPAHAVDGDRPARPIPGLGQESR